MTDNTDGIEQSIIDGYVDRVFTVAQVKLDEGQYEVDGNSEQFIEEVSAKLLTYAETHAKTVIVDDYQGDATAYPEDKLVEDVKNVIDEQYVACGGTLPDETVVDDEVTEGDNTVVVETTPDDSSLVEDEPSVIEPEFTEIPVLGDEQPVGVVDDNEDVSSESLFPDDGLIDSDLLNQTFMEVKYRSGYDTEDVYEFQRELVRGLQQIPRSVLVSNDDNALPDRSDLTVTPDSLRSIRDGMSEVNFRNAYDMAEVNEFADKYLAELDKRFAVLEERYAELEAKQEANRKKREYNQWREANKEQHSSEIAQAWDNAHAENKEFDDAIKRAEEERIAAEEARIAAENEWIEQQARSAREEEERLERERIDEEEARQRAEIEQQERVAELERLREEEEAREAQANTMLTLTQLTSSIQEMRFSAPEVAVKSVNVGNDIGGMFNVGGVSYDEGSQLIAILIGEDSKEGISLLELFSALNYVEDSVEDEVSPMVVMRSPAGYHPIVDITTSADSEVVELVVQS